MKILLPGGSGQVGTVLARACLDNGHEPVVLSRSQTPTQGLVAVFPFEDATWPAAAAELVSRWQALR